MDELTVSHGENRYKISRNLFERNSLAFDVFFSDSISNVIYVDDNVERGAVTCLVAVNDSEDVEFASIVPTLNNKELCYLSVLCDMFEMDTLDEFVSRELETRKCVDDVISNASEIYNCGMRSRNLMRLAESWLPLVVQREKYDISNVTGFPLDVLNGLLHRKGMLMSNEARSELLLAIFDELGNDAAVLFEEHDVRKFPDDMLTKLLKKVESKSVLFKSLGSDVLYSRIVKRENEFISKQKIANLENLIIEAADNTRDSRQKFAAGKLVYEGVNVEKDPVKGVKLIKQAADSGNTEAILYYSNILFTQNETTEALQRLKKGAEYGDMSCTISLITYLMSNMNYTISWKREAFDIAIRNGYVSATSTRSLDDMTHFVLVYFRYINDDPSLIGMNIFDQLLANMIEYLTADQEMLGSWSRKYVEFIIQNESIDIASPTLANLISLCCRYPAITGQWNVKVVQNAIRAGLLLSTRFSESVRATLLSLYVEEMKGDVSILVPQIGALYPVIKGIPMGISLAKIYTPLLPSGAISFKVVLLGNSQSGKSALLHSVLKKKSVYEPKPTEGAVFHAHRVFSFNRTFTIQAIDTSGSETDAFYEECCSGADAAIIVCNLQQKDVIANLVRWRELYYKNNSAKHRICVVESQCDIKHNDSKAADELTQWCMQNNIRHLKTSVPFGIGTEEVIEMMINTSIVNRCACDAKTEIPAKLFKVRGKKK